MNTRITTDVIIVGAGPAGMLLAKILKNNNIGCLLVERRRMKYVLSRIRAGVIEKGSVELLNNSGVGDRLKRECQSHNGFNIYFGQNKLRINLNKLVNSYVTVYGQSEITKDLYQALKIDNVRVFDNIENIIFGSSLGSNPQISFKMGNENIEISGKFIVGCDGSRSIVRSEIPENKKKEFTHEYAFGWFGILSKSKPLDTELIYSSNERGFALCSMRSQTVSRYYVQCCKNQSIDNWTDALAWDSLREFLPQSLSEKLETGQIIDKSITPLRSFVCEPMQYKRIFLAGDAAHVVPPTGAKGLNLAFSDIHYLSTALIHFFKSSDERPLIKYSENALKRVWKTEKFSWWMTSMLHTSDPPNSFAEKIRESEFSYLFDSESAQKVLAENYVGLPY